MRLDASFVNQPAQHVGRAIGAITEEPGRMKSEVLCCSLDHALGGENLRLPDRRCRLNIDNDRILNIDQIVRGVSEERLSAMGAGPACCWISRKDELGNDLGRGPKGRIIQHGQILLDGTAHGLWGQPLLALDAVLPVRVRLDQAGINRKAFSANQPLVDTATQDHLEQTSQQITITEATMTVLREGRMVGDIAIEPKAAEPAIR